jgi:hypothetical protein
MFNPWGYTTARQSIGLLPREFESYQDATIELQKRIACLRVAGTLHHRLLAEHLEQCCRDSRCMLAACPLCMRQYRMWLVGEMIHIFEPYPELAAVTLIPAARAVGRDELVDVIPKRLRDTLRQQLHRYGNLHGPIIGGIDGDYDEANSVWQPHYHLIMPASLSNQFVELKTQYLPSTRRVYRPLLVQPVGDRAAQMSYAVKSYWPRKVRYYDQHQRKRTIHRRLKPAMHADWLVWRSQFDIPEFCFLAGVRRYGGSLRPILS